MAVYWECPECKRKNSTKALTCPGCETGTKKRTPAYWIEYYLTPGQGKKREMQRLFGFTETQARQAEQEKRRSVRRGEHYCSGQNGIKTLKDVCDRYLNEFQIENPDYYPKAVLYTTRMTEFMGANTKIERVSVELIDAWRLHLRSMTSRRGGQLAESNVDKYLDFGRAMWNKHLKRVYNPWREAGRYRPDNQVTNFLSEDEVRRLLQAAKARGRHLYEMILISLLTSLRKTNVLGLKRSEVRLEYGIATVVQKGGKTHTTHLSKPLLDMLAAVPENGTDWYWINPHTGKPYLSLLRPLKRLICEAGITKPIRWHDLRHTAATLFYRASRDLIATQRHLGHASIKHTLRYAHLIPGVQEGYLNRVAEMVAPVVPTVEAETAEARTPESTHLGTHHNSESVDIPPYIQ